MYPDSKLSINGLRYGILAAIMEQFSTNIVQIANAKYKTVSWFESAVHMVVIWAMRATTTLSIVSNGQVVPTLNLRSSSKEAKNNNDFFLNSQL